MGAWQVLPAGRARGGGCSILSSPPRGGSRGWTRGQTRCDWPAAAGGGARPPVSRGPPQKSPGYCRAHWSPGQRAACPRAAGQLGLGNSALLWRLRPYKPLDLTCLWAPPTSTPCPHAPAPATGKGCCVFFPASVSLHACPGERGLGPGLPRFPILPLPRCSRGAQLSGCRSAHPRSLRVPEHAYRVRVRTSTSQS